MQPVHLDLRVPGVESALDKSGGSTEPSPPPDVGATAGEPPNASANVAIDLSQTSTETEDESANAKDYTPL
eukprot:14651680-Alexandrium_andersonii.AAC.1